MCNQCKALPIWLATLLFTSLTTTEVAGVTVKARDDGDGDGGDGGDGDGGMGGLAGALSGMMGGGGGGGGSDDDDPNMVGKGKKSGGSDGGNNGGVDLKGLENGLASGGVDQLTAMLSAMQAAHGSSAETHIKKGPNGEEMYDFRDMDDGFTTLAPITMRPMPTAPPGPGLVPMPKALPKEMPTKLGDFPKLGQLRGSPDKDPTFKGKKLTVWTPDTPSTPPVAPQVAAPLAPAFATPVAPPYAAPVAPYGAPVAPAFTAPGAPVVGNAASSLYQGLASLRQNMDYLVSQAAVIMNGDSSLSSKVDQLSQNMATEEKKLEGKVETLEDENKNLKKELDQQQHEIKEMTAEAAATHKAKAQSKSRSKMIAGYSTKPWEATFSVHLDGKVGGKEDSFTIRVHPEWAPEGAKRFQDIVRDGLLQDARFFRVVPNFMVQFGIPASPKLAAAWQHKRIHDDPVKQSNHRGTLSFASSGPNTRTTQVFINFADNQFLDQKGFTPFAEVLGDGMTVVDKIQSKYKEKPKQGQIYHHGNTYLMKHFPDLSFIGHVNSSLIVPDVPVLFQDAGNTGGAKQHSKQLGYGGIRTFFHHKKKVGQ